MESGIEAPLSPLHMSSSKSAMFRTSSTLEIWQCITFKKYYQPKHCQVCLTVAL